MYHRNCFKCNVNIRMKEKRENNDMNNNMNNNMEMNDNKADNAKKEGKKSLIKFILVMVIAFIVGGVCGFFSVKIKKYSAATIAEYARSFALYAVPIFYLVSNIVLFIGSLSFYLKALKYEKLIAESDDDDETVYEKTESFASFSGIIGSITLILNLALFPATVELAKQCVENKQIFLAILVASVALFILGYVWILFFQAKAVALAKRLNPEKKGDVFSANFNKQWVKSCDEAEKMAIYKASYTAFKAVNTSCLALWLVCLVFMTIFETGMLALIMVCTIYMILNVSYFVGCMRSEKSKKGNKYE